MTVQSCSLFSMTPVKGLPQAVTLVCFHEISAVFYSMQQISSVKFFFFFFQRQCCNDYSLVFPSSFFSLHRQCSNGYSLLSHILLYLHLVFTMASVSRLKQQGVTDTQCFRDAGTATDGKALPHSPLGKVSPRRRRYSCPTL